METRPPAAVSSALRGVVWRLLSLEGVHLSSSAAPVCIMASNTEGGSRGEASERLTVRARAVGARAAVAHRQLPPARPFDSLSLLRRMI